MFITFMVDNHVISDMQFFLAQISYNSQPYFSNFQLLTIIIKLFDILGKLIIIFSVIILYFLVI